MREKINPIMQLVDSAKQLNNRLSNGLLKIKSMREDNPGFETAVKDLEQLQKETDTMLKRLSVSIRSSTESVN